MLFGPSHSKFKSYEDYLQLSAALSRLFSDTPKGGPHIDPKWLERLFCEAFELQNIAGKSTSFDALQLRAESDRVGVGLKTFLMHNWSPKFEKIAEFNKAFTEQAWDLSDSDALVRRVSDLRNVRVLSDAREYGVDPLKSIYHCVGRASVKGTSKLLVFEEPYPLIAVNNLELVDGKSRNAVEFRDGSNIYKFAPSKSVLYKKFGCSLAGASGEISANIIDDPFAELLKWYRGRSPNGDTPSPSGSPSVPLLADSAIAPAQGVPGKDYVVLPLYSTREKSAKSVPERSGLNQWNAGGRVRDFGVSHGKPFGEMYIPVPAPIRQYFRSFFPSRDEQFMLIVPTGEKLIASLCQQGEKALMSNPNKALSSWLFSILGFTPKAGMPLSYKDLYRVDKDAVRIDKLSDGRYTIRLCPLGAYESFCRDASLDIADSD